MSIAEGLRSWWADRRAENEYYGLPEAERAAIARDVRLPESTVEHLVEQGGSTPLELPRMLQALHLDPAEVTRRHPGVMRDLEATCAGCCEHNHCRRDLDDGLAAQLYEGYCPNALTMDALLQEQASGAGTAS